MSNAYSISKAHKLLFPVSSSGPLFPLDLTHSNAWDQVPVMSPQGFVWLYPLLQKSDVFNVFQLFQNMFEDLFEH